MGGWDLHTHSDLSDGVTPIEQNVADAIAVGLDGLGVTDHDTTAPFDRAIAAADGTGLEIICGTEFSAELRGTSVHVLGYWIDPANAPLQEELDRLFNERERRAVEIVRKFNEDCDIPVSIERVRELAGESPIARPHIARAVVETGAASEISEVFDTWLADDGPAYVPKYAVDPVRAVELLIGAGGVAVVAHPGLYGARTGDALDEATIEAMAAAGMAGIEADHPEHTDEHREQFRRLAAGLDLVVTAGSDYHGGARDRSLGEVTTSRAAVEALRERRPTA